MAGARRRQSNLAADGFYRRRTLKNNAACDTVFGRRGNIARELLDRCSVFQHDSACIVPLCRKIAGNKRCRRIVQGQSDGRCRRCFRRQVISKVADNLPRCEVSVRRLGIVGPGISRRNGKIRSRADSRGVFVGDRVQADRFRFIGGCSVENAVNIALAA